MRGPASTAARCQARECGGCRLGGARNVDILDPRRGGGKRLPVLPKSVEAEVTRLTDERADLVLGLPGGHTAREVWNRASGR